MNKTICAIALASVFLSAGAIASPGNPGDCYAYQDGYGYHDGYHRGPHGGMMFGRGGPFRDGPRGFGNSIAEMQPTSIADILKNADDDKLVKVQGTLTKYLGDEHYEFTDKNNDKIVVELDKDRDWSYIAKDMPIEIIAEVDKDKMSTKLDVKAAIPNLPEGKRPRDFGAAEPTDSSDTGNKDK
ncbi:MAG: NirD/YgiW/YdeI family stress tolerance protein [Succinivibrio sp.]|nr:NirD/YgiW/YdeI family stress tolerance protein [Succinivibrio sp.]